MAKLLDIRKHLTPKYRTKCYVPTEDQLASLVKTKGIEIVTPIKNRLWGKPDLKHSVKFVGHYHKEKIEECLGEHLYMGGYEFQYREYNLPYLLYSNVYILCPLCYDKHPWELCECRNIWRSKLHTVRIVGRRVEIRSDQWVCLTFGELS